VTKSKKILFVCVENAGRSQMAEGFLRKYAPNFDVISAGTKPKSQLNPTVVEVMKEIGIDIAKQIPKELTEEMISSSITVNMGCMDRDSCPSLFVKDVIDWNISDPKEKDIVQVREIRDKIKNEVLNLVKKLETQP
jgi:protein-tyrosine-phosphatase